MTPAQPDRGFLPAGQRLRLWLFCLTALVLALLWAGGAACRPRRPSRDPNFPAMEFQTFNQCAPSFDGKPIYSRNGRAERVAG